MQSISSSTVFQQVSVIISLLLSFQIYVHRVCNRIRLIIREELSLKKQLQNVMSLWTVITRVNVKLIVSFKIRDYGDHKEDHAITDIHLNFSLTHILYNHLT